MRRGCYQARQSCGLQSADVLTRLSTSAEPSGNIQEAIYQHPRSYILKPRKLYTSTPEVIYSNLKSYIFKFCKQAPHALKGQKLLAQGIALGMLAIGKAPCKGKSFVNCLVTFPCNFQGFWGKCRDRIKKKQAAPRIESRLFKTIIS